MPWLIWWKRLCFVGADVEHVSAGLRSVNDHGRPEIGDTWAPHRDTRPARQE